ncbi:MAG: diguanylate cyclase [Treponema sp.]|nr:MAG: diguanylate cyclase [Treponema sp.]
MTERKKQWLDTLRPSKLFCDLTDDELYYFVSKMYYCEFEEDMALVYEGELGNELYIILEGSVLISIMSEDERIDLAKIGAGNFFGEMSMLEQEPRSATCSALSLVKCLALKSRYFTEMISDAPIVTAKVLNNMLEITSARLLSTDSFLTQVIQWGAEAKNRAITDAFTGLFNRRYLDDSLEMIISSCLRDKIGLSFAMVDIDHFGTLNKEYGTKFCDNMLLRIVEVFKEPFDDDDILIRYGGDEFCFIIRGPVQRAVEQCSQVCKKVNALKFSEYPALTISCSIGIAEYKTGINTAEFMKLADTALYDAKEAGRNRVSTNVN